MRDKEDKKTQEEIIERLQPAAGQKQLFEYAVKGIEEKFIINIIILKEKNGENYNINESETKKTEAIKWVIRITSMIYEGSTLYLPISIISPQYDLKNTLVNELTGSLNGFRESIIDAPIDKPGIQDFIMLKISLLLDMPRICTLFLEGATKKIGAIYSDYRFCEDEKINAEMVDTFSHNIGRFLKDKRVSKIMTELGREKKRVLDKWYDKLAEAKLQFITKNFKFLGLGKSRDDLDRLRGWFFQRHDFRKGWEAIAPNSKFQKCWIWLFPLAVILFFLGLTIPVRYTLTDSSLKILKDEDLLTEEIIEDLEPLKNKKYNDYNQFVDALIKQTGKENTETYKVLILKNTSIKREPLEIQGTYFSKIISFLAAQLINAPLYILTVLFILWVTCISLQKYHRISGFLEMLIPRLFLGIIAGSPIFAFSELVWRFSTKVCNPRRLIIYAVVIFSFIGIYLYSKIIDDIGIDNKIEAFFRVFWVIIFSIFLASLPMSGFYLALVVTIGERLCFCSGLFWVSVLLFAGFFLHLIWHDKRIADPL